MGTMLAKRMRLKSNSSFSSVPIARLWSASQLWEADW